MLFGEALKQAREKAGMTQAQLAERAGLSLRTVQSWEQGRRSPVSPDFFKLVKALRVSADTFAVVTEDGPKPPRLKAKPRHRKPKGK
jgi:transcriptional regulator with XRE-family HTH domain